jgi:hypothetical protein
MRREVRLPSPSLVFGLLVGCGVTLVVLSTIGRWVPYEFVYVHISVDEELAVPTWFAVVQLFVLATAAGLAAVTSEHRSERRALWATSLVALFFSVDEQATIHEALTGALPEVFPRIRDRGAWMFVYPVVLMAIGVWLRRDIAWSWPHRRRLLLRILAGAAVFGTGVGLEAVQYLTGFPTLLIHIEEFLEMVGVSVMLWAIYSEMWPVTITLGERTTTGR